MLKGMWGRTARDPFRAALGSLEREVMEIVWNADEVTVREVQAKLERPVAYTTAMTTLDRLFKKGYVVRTMSGRAFVYRASGSREQTQAAVASGVLKGLITGGAAVPILSNLVDAVGSQDGGLDLLNALEDLVREKRRRIEEGEDGK
jgi:predicted transcriptional regulator